MTAVYTIEYEASAVKALSKLDHITAVRIKTVVDALSRNPRPSGVKKLMGSDNWRVRVGDYRVIYSIHDSTLTILIIKIGHRREIYHER